MISRMRRDGSPFDFYKFKAGAYDFWRCYKCHAIFTYEQERSRIANMEFDCRATMCPCRSLRYSPTLPSVIEWLKPSVITYTLKLVLARGLAPWLEDHCPKALPLVERLVKPLEA